MHVRRLRLRRRAETRNLLSAVARDIRANTFVSLSRASPRTRQSARPFKGRSRPKNVTLRARIFQSLERNEIQFERDKTYFPIARVHDNDRIFVFTPRHVLDTEGASGSNVFVLRQRPAYLVYL